VTARESGENEARRDDATHAMRGNGMIHDTPTKVGDRQAKFTFDQPHCQRPTFGQFYPHLPRHCLVAYWTDSIVLQCYMGCLHKPSLHQIVDSLTRLGQPLGPQDHVTLPRRVSPHGLLFCQYCCYLSNPLHMLCNTSTATNTYQRYFSASPVPPSTLKTTPTSQLHRSWRCS
jgi:hypothetical protein